MSDEATQRSLALLEATHVFPGEYALSVIAKNAEAVTAEVRRAVEEVVASPIGEGNHDIIASSGGKYLSHRLRLQCQRAEDVLRLYARIRAIQGVVTVL